MIPVQTGRAWHSFGTLTSLFSLLINAVISEVGDVLGRVGDITELRQKFIGYDGPSLSGDGLKPGKVKKDGGKKPAKKR
jgi:hypothetical protein